MDVVMLDNLCDSRFISIPAGPDFRSVAAVVRVDA